MLDAWLSLWDDLLEAAFGLGSRLSPIYLIAMIVIAFGIYQFRRPQTSFVSWVFPKDIYAHPSHMTDLKLFVAGKFIAVLGLLNVSLITVTIIYGVTETFGRSEAEIGVLTPFFLAGLYLLVSDFCTYWVHRGHHEIKAIWPFHAVHHSAEVMTPITVYRKHPIYDLLSKSLRAVLVGLANGLVIALLVGKPTLTMIAGVNVFIVIFNVIGSNFRHSHIWISYGAFWEHIFISPAQHQIHHSLAHKHWHKNYGEVLAIWDWMFGTLYVPEKAESLTFGLSTEDGARIEQPYPTLKASLIKPFQESWQVLQKSEQSLPLGQSSSSLEKL